MTDNTAAAQAQEIEATMDYVTADLDGTKIRVLLPVKWRPSYLRGLRSGDIDTWAEGVIHPDDLAEFIDADPTFEEIGTFASEAMTATGEEPGKSGARTPSSTRTRRK